MPPAPYLEINQIFRKTSRKKQLCCADWPWRADSISVSKASFCSSFIVSIMLSLMRRASSSSTTSVWRSSCKHSRRFYETYVEGFRVLVKGGLVDCRQAQGGQVETVKLQDGVDVIEGPCSSSLLTASAIPHLFLEHGKEECLKDDFAESILPGP